VVARVASFTQVMDVADFWNPTGCRVLDGHVGEGRVAQAGAEITRRFGGVANFQAGDGGDVYESAFDSVRPGVYVWACAQAGES
jgi:hypothetical protein